MFPPGPTKQPEALVRKPGQWFLFISQADGNAGKF